MKVIYSYTRAQAVADGVQVEVTKIAHEAGAPAGYKQVNIRRQKMSDS